MREPPRLHPARAVGYAAGNLGKNLVWNSLEFCLLFLLTDFLGLPPSTAGLLILGSMIWDAALHPLIGTLIDPSRTRYGKYGAYLLLGAPLVGGSFVLIFALPSLSETPEPHVILICLLLFRTAYTLVDLPHNAMIARVSQSSRERSLLSGLRYLFSSAGSILIATALVPLFEAVNRSGDRDQFLPYAIGIAALATCALWISWWSVRPIDRAMARGPRASARFFSSLPSLRHNRPFMVLLAVVFVTGLSTPGFTKLLLYYGKYVVGNEALGAAALMAFTIASALGTIGWTFLAQSWDKGRVLRLAHALVAVTCVGFFLLRPASIEGLSLLAGLVGAASAGAYMLIWALAPDVVDDHEARAGVRLESSAFAFLGLAMKAAIGLGGALSGWLLDLIGFVPGATPSAPTLESLRLLHCGIPIAGSVLICMLLQRYQLGHQAHAANIVELRKRAQRDLN